MARWTRWLAPTLGDIQLVSMLVWVFAVGSAGWARLLMDGDAGWHIRTGQWILQHAAVPRVDLYSFTKPGEPWFAWEWLSEIIFGGLFTLWGFKAVVLFAGILVACFGAVMFQHAVWRGANVFIALPICLLAVGASTVHLLARPHLWTWILFAVSWLMIDRDRRNPSRVIWWLVPLAVVWTNLHGGFMVLIATLGLVAAGTAVEAWRGIALWSTVKRYALLAAATAAASFVNPYGWQLHRHVVEYLNSAWIREVVSEFQSPSFRSEPVLCYEIFLFAGLVLGGWLLSRGRVVEPLVIAFWAHQSLISARHIPLLCVAALPVVAGELAGLWEPWTRRCKKSSLPAILASLGRDLQPSLGRYSLCAVAPLVVLAFMNEPLHWPTNFPEEIFPVEIVDKHADVIRGSRIYTQDQWADYLIFHFYPDQRVFFDGRSDFYGPVLGDEYLRIMKGAHDWDQLLDKYRINVVLTPVKFSLASLLKLKPGWRLVADDGKALLFQRIVPMGAPKTRPPA